MDLGLRELAELTGGALDGDGELRVKRASSIAEARQGDITFAAGPKFEELVETTAATAVLVREDFGASSKPLIRVRDPLEAFLVVCAHFIEAKPRPAIGVHVNACVADGVTLGADVHVHPFASVGEGTVVGDRVDIHAGVCVGADCRIGDDVVLHPNVVLYDHTVLGDRVVIHANATIGCDGFGYRPDEQGRLTKVPQLGRVEIADDVEIGAGATVDRATFGVTRIGEGTKIDNMVMVAHNCEIGRHFLLVSQVGIAGSCTVGDRVVMGGQVGIVDHVTIGAGAILGAQAGVTKEVRPGETVFGSPAGPVGEMKRSLLGMRRLPEYRKRILALEKRLSELEAKQEGGGR